MPIFKISVAIILVLKFLLSSLRRAQVPTPTIQTIQDLSFVQAAAVFVMSQERQVVRRIFSCLSKADGTRLMKAMTKLPHVEVAARHQVTTYLASKLRLQECELPAFATHHPQIVAVEIECWLREVVQSPRGD